jgi:hypothetical protein
MGGKREAGSLGHCDQSPKPRHGGDPTQARRDRDECGIKALERPQHARQEQLAPAFTKAHGHLAKADRGDGTIHCRQALGTDLRMSGQP